MNAGSKAADRSVSEMFNIHVKHLVTNIILETTLSVFPGKSGTIKKKF